MDSGVDGKKGATEQRVLIYGLGRSGRGVARFLAKEGKKADWVDARPVPEDEALTADDQVMALSEVIRAHEQGQAALRDSLRRAALREAQVRAEFEEQRDHLSRIIGVMTAMQQSPETLMLLHPAGATSTAQSGRSFGATTPFFSVLGVVTMEIGVTSEPVPAVVGTRISGRRSPLARPTP